MARPAPPFNGPQLLEGELAPLAELRPNGGLRRLNYRWELARHVLKSPDSKAREFFGRCVVQDALEFQRVLLDCKTPARVRALRGCRRPIPAILDALLVWRKNDRFRALLEARLLAREKPGDISRKMCMPAAAVDWYERLFFAVGDRLSSPDWIMVNILPGEFYANPAAVDETVWWKYYGYWGGPHVLDLLVYGGFSARRHVAQGNVFGFLRDATLSLLKQRAAIAARTLPIGEPRTALWMVRALLRQVKREQKQPAEDHDERWRQMLNAMRQAWPALWDGEESGDGG